MTREDEQAAVSTETENGDLGQLLAKLEAKEANWKETYFYNKTNLKLYKMNIFLRQGPLARNPFRSV